MTDKQINRWLRRQFSRVGWILILYYLLMNAFALLGMLQGTVTQLLQAFVSGRPGQSVDMEAAMGNAWGYIVTTLAGIAILHGWKGPEYWHGEILAKEARMRPGVFLAMICLCLGAQMVNTLWVTGLELVMNSLGGSVMGILESVSGSTDTVSMFLYASLLAPIGEEILFRGYVLRSLRPYGKRFAVFGSALLFGLFHGNLLQTPYAILAGLILGYLTVEYSIRWAILLHIFNNLVLAELFTRLVSGLPEVAYSMANLLLFGGGFAAALAILIRNRQQIRDYTRSEWMDRRVLKCFFTNSGILVLTAIAAISMISLFFV